MVEMMIFSLKQGEVQAVYHTAKDLAARLTEEKWMFHCLETAKRAEEFVKSNPELDVICMDITAGFKEKKPGGLHDSHSKSPAIACCIYEAQHYGRLPAFAASG